jgi:hypothetical protein
MVRAGFEKCIPLSLSFSPPRAGASWESGAAKGSNLSLLPARRALSLPSTSKRSAPLPLGPYCGGDREWMDSKRNPSFPGANCRAKVDQFGALWELGRDQRRSGVSLPNHPLPQPPPSFPPSNTNKLSAEVKTKIVIKQL